MKCFLCSCEADVFFMNEDIVYFYCADCFTQLKKGQKGCNNLRKVKLMPKSAQPVQSGYHGPVLRKLLLVEKNTAYKIP